MQAARKHGTAERLAADLIGVPYVTVQSVAASYGISDQGATKVVRALVDLGMLEPTSFRARRGAQLYGAPDVLRVLLD